MIITDEFKDISMKISGEMIIYDGDPKFSYKYTNSIDNGDICNTWQMSLGSHTGTHIDAPLHFFKNGLAVDQLPLSYFIGKAKIIGINHPNAITYNEIKSCGICEGDRILFKTKNSDFSSIGAFKKDYVYIDAEAAKYLVEQKVRTVGVDYLSVERFGSTTHDTHRTFLKNNIVLIEGLRLKEVTSGEYEMIGIPLNIKEGNGSPIRVIIRKI